MAMLNKFGKFTVVGSLSKILDEAPSVENLIKTLELTEAQTASHSSMSKIKEMAGIKAPLAENLVAYTIDENLPLVQAAIVGYKADLSLLTEAVSNKFSTIADMIPKAIEALFLPSSHDGSTQIRGEIEFSDPSSSDELQKIAIKLTLYQVRSDGGEEMVLSAYLPTIANLAWASFRYNNSDSPSDLFVSRYSPLSSVKARKTRLAARILTQAHEFATNASGHVDTSISTDLKEISTSNPTMWKRLMRACAGEILAPAKSDAVSGSSQVGIGDRGDGGVSGSAKDNRREGKARRDSASSTRAFTISTSVLQGSIDSTLDLLRVAFDKTKKTMSPARLDKSSEGVFTIDINGLNEPFCASIQASVGLFLEETVTSSSSPCNKMSHLTHFANIKSRLTLRGQPSVIFGTHLENIINLSDEMNSKMTSFWVSVPELYIKLKALKDKLSNLIDPNVDALDLQKQSRSLIEMNTVKIQEIEDLIRSGLTAIKVASENLAIGAQSLHAVAKATDNEFDGSYTGFASIMAKVATAIASGAEKAAKSLKATDVVSDSDRIAHALKVILSKANVKEEKDLDARECAIKQATELKVVDWSVGDRKEFAPWLTDPAEVLKVYNFKGTEVGEGVTQSKSRLKNSSLKIASSLDDMASILNLKHDTLSLDGKVSVSFGARPISATAEYRIKEAMMVFKDGMQGDGALMHEWFHALDMVDNGASSLSGVDTNGIQSEVQEVLSKLKRVIRSGDKSFSVDYLDDLRASERHRVNVKTASYSEMLTQLKDESNLVARDIVAVISSLITQGRELMTSAAVTEAIAKFDPENKFSILDSGLTNLVGYEYRSVMMPAGIWDNVNAYLRNLENLPPTITQIKNQSRNRGLSEEAIGAILEATKPAHEVRKKIQELSDLLCSSIYELFGTRSRIYKKNASIESAKHNITTIESELRRIESSDSFESFIASSRGGFLRTKIAHLDGWPSKMMLHSLTADSVTDKKGYWSSVEEMGARAFEVYGTAKMEEAGLVNTFLIDAQRSSPSRSGNQVYPSGDHAKAINEVFDELFAILRRLERINLRY